MEQEGCKDGSGGTHTTPLFFLLKKNIHLSCGDALKNSNPAWIMGWYRLQ